MASTIQSTSVNIDRLKEATQSNPKFKAIFEVYSERQRGRQDSTLPRIRRVMKDKHVDISAQELAEFFRLTQEAHAGKWQQGRKANTGRFIWNYNLKSVADAVLGRTSQLKSAPKAKHRLPNITVEQIATPVIPEEPSPLVQFAAEAFPINPVQHRTLIVRKAGIEVEIHLDELTDADLKSTALLLNNL